jgi:hypothetical protein
MPIPIHLILHERGQGDQAMQDPINGALTTCVGMNIHVDSYVPTTNKDTRQCTGFSFKILIQSCVTDFSHTAPPVVQGNNRLAVVIVEFGAGAAW